MGTIIVNWMLSHIVPILLVDLESFGASELSALVNKYPALSPFLSPIIAKLQ